MCSFLRVYMFPRFLMFSHVFSCFHDIVCFLMFSHVFSFFSCPSVSPARSRVLRVPDSQHMTRTWKGQVLCARAAGCKWTLNTSASVAVSAAALVSLFPTGLETQQGHWTWTAELSSLRFQHWSFKASLASTRADTTIQVALLAVSNSSTLRPTARLRAVKDVHSKLVNGVLSGRTRLPRVSLFDSSPWHAQSNASATMWQWPCDAGFFLSHVDDASSVPIMVGASAHVHTNSWQRNRKQGASSVPHVRDDSVRTTNSSITWCTNIPVFSSVRLQTLLLSRSWFPNSDHIQAFKTTWLDHGRSSVHNNSLLGAVPTSYLPTRLRFTNDQQHGQEKTQHSVHKKERSAELGRVVVNTQHRFYSDTRVRWAVLYATFHTPLGREFSEWVSASERQHSRVQCSNLLHHCSLNLKFTWLGLVRQGEKK